MMTEVFQFALEKRGRGERKSRGSRTRDGEKLGGDDTAAIAILEKMCLFHRCVSAEIRHFAVNMHSDASRRTCPQLV